MSVFSFSRLKKGDLPLLHEWLNRPHIAERWDGPFTAASMPSKFNEHMISKHLFGYLAMLDGMPVGYIQTYEATKVGGGWWSDVVEGTWGIDQFLADGSSLGVGLGTKMVEAFTEFVFATHNAKQIITDPSPDNPRALRCYEKAGFKVLKQIDTPDGPAILMQKNPPKN